jgi:hypothetical protein
MVTIIQRLEPAMARWPTHFTRGLLEKFVAMSKGKTADVHTISVRLPLAVTPTPKISGYVPTLTIAQNSVTIFSRAATEILVAVLPVAVNIPHVSNVIFFFVYL